MLLRILICVVVLSLTQTAAQARRVALVIGQNAYTGGTSATVGLPTLTNPAGDAARMAKLLEQYGFEVIACDGKTPGCFDLDRARFLGALKRLEQRAAGADLALVFFAGHGLASVEGNILAPVDAKLNCSTGAVTNGVVVERIMKATGLARHKLVILDACRDNPLGEVCPNLKDKKLSFTRIEAGAMQGSLLVTSTQFGQQALDGPPGNHSPPCSRPWRPTRQYISSRSSTRWRGRPMRPLRSSAASYRSLEGSWAERHLVTAWQARAALEMLVWRRWPSRMTGWQQMRQASATCWRRKRRLAASPTP
jgi:hypothetical protein